MSEATKNSNGRNNDLKGGISGSDPLSPLKEAAARLAASIKPPELKLPPTKRLDMSALDLLDLQEQEAEEQDTMIAPRVGEWMEGDSLPNLDKIEAKVKKLGDRVLQLVAGKNESGENITFGQQREEYIRLNAEYLSAAFPIGETETGEPFLLPAMKTRRAAHMAVLKHRLRPEMDREQLIDAVNLCVKDGYFAEDQEGYIPLWQRHYALSDSEKFGGLGEAEERLLGEIVGHHVSRINSLFKEDVGRQAEDLKRQADTGFELHQLLAGEPGKCFVYVPPEMRGNFRLSAVHLLLEGDGNGKAFIVGAAGFDAKMALDIRDSKIHLNLQHMEISHPPRIETMMDKWRFSEENARRYQIFWEYLDRAARAQEEKDRREQEKELAAKAKREEEEAFAKASEESAAIKEKYSREATISLDRVLMEMEPMEGIFFGEFRSNNGRGWRNPDGNIIPDGLLYFLGEQKVVCGKAQMKVRKAPDHLISGFFPPECMEFAPCDETFRDLKQPLQGLMKALRRQVKHQAETVA